MYMCSMIGLLVLLTLSMTATVLANPIDSNPLEFDGGGIPRGSLDTVATVNSLSTYDEFQFYTHGQAELISRHVLTSHSPWERSLSDLLIRQLQRGGSAIDIGCNIGSISLPVAAYLKKCTQEGTCPKSRVLCIEAVPQNAALVYHSKLANSFDQLSVVNRAIVPKSSTESTICLSVNENNYGGSHTEAINSVTSDACVTSVATATLDSIIEESKLNNVMIIKLDCEGCEGNAIFSGENFFRATPPCMVTMEVWAPRLIQFGTSLWAMYQKLKSYGYVAEKFTRCNLHYLSDEYPFPEKNDKQRRPDCDTEADIEAWFRLADTVTDTADRGTCETARKTGNCDEHYKQCRYTCGATDQSDFRLVQKDLEACATRVLEASQFSDQ
eukprot:m.12603 g.12603  ORF g.12603 m.12603 type:complete len:384 (+) comp9379_c1_seq1:80-1231(+)